MLAHRAQAGVQFAAQAQHILGVAVERFLLPSEGRCPQHGEQGGRGSQHDLACLSVIVEIGLDLQGARQHSIARHEAHDEFRAVVESAPVGLGHEGVDVSAKSCGVLLQEVVALSGSDLRALGLQECAERSFGVDDQRLVTGQMHHDVRAHGRVVPGGPADLLIEVASLHHPGVLQHPAQLRLAPHSSYTGGVQRPGQGRGLLPESVGAQSNVLEHGTEGPELLDSVSFQGVDVLGHPVQGVSQGSQLGGDRTVFGAPSPLTLQLARQQVALAAQRGDLSDLTLPFG